MHAGHSSSPILLPFSAYNTMGPAVFERYGPRLLPSSFTPLTLLNTTQPFVISHPSFQVPTLKLSFVIQSCSLICLHHSLLQGALFDLSQLAPMSPAFAAHKTVCVMDASGPLGAPLVERLLRRGYAVHAAVYNHDKVSSLQRLSSDSKRLKIFMADPFDFHSIMDAMKGCSGLFYTFEQPQDEPYDEFMAEIEMRAAHNVLEACAQTVTMERVVYTSSVTAVVWKENRKLMAKLDERDWSEPSYCRKLKLWHALAKTLAEKTAWALAMDRGVDMVSINAGLLTGPELSVTNPYLKGTPEMYEDGVMVTVDAKYLADAHVAAYESTSAYGRYMCFNNAVCRPEDAVKLARMLNPASPAPAPSDELRVIKQRIQNGKMSEMMTEFAAERHVEGL